MNQSIEIESQLAAITESSIGVKLPPSFNACIEQTLELDT